MDTLLLSLLLVPWLKCLINWVVVLVQRHYVIRSFSGFFCISLTLIESFLCFIITAIYYLEDFNISGWRLTRHHVCLLVQIACFICSVLHWPVFLLAVLDNFWTLSPITAKTSWTRKLTYTAGVFLLWILATFYVFWVPDVVLLLGDDKHRCHLFSSSQTLQVLGALLFTVSCVILYSFTTHVKPREQVCLHSTRGTQQSYSMRLFMYTFVSTWAPFVVLMIIFPFLQNEMNAYLQMNTVWLCFLNSFSVALALCRRSFASDSNNSHTVTDGFCSWSFCFICGAEVGNKRHIHTFEWDKLRAHNEGKSQFFLE